MGCLGYAILFLTFAISFFADFSMSATEKCHPDDKKALLQLKKDLNDPYVIISWNANTDCCDWYCVSCDEKTYRITEIDISNDNFSSQIPSSVGNIPALKSLTLRKLDNLWGEIPPAIQDLKRLTFLRLSWNRLSGPVPAWFSELQELTYLDLAFNSFTGQIPPTLSKLQKLEALHLDRNQLTGEIPESFGHFKGTVPDLYLSHNNLSGKIPESFGNLDFERIDLSRNKLVGDASQIFRGSKSAQVVDLSRNLLEFNLSGVTFPTTSLIYLDLNHNKIYGGIPKQILKVENLQHWNVSYNKLCGEIPQGAALKRFDSSSYIHNKCLCGPPLSPCK